MQWARGTESFASFYFLKEIFEEKLNRRSKPEAHRSVPLDFKTIHRTIKKAFSQRVQKGSILVRKSQLIFPQIMFEIKELRFYFF